jgi:hypothetical protein
MGGVVHSSHRLEGKLHRFCALSPGPAGTRLQSGSRGCKQTLGCTRFEAVSTPKTRPVQGCFELSTGKWRCLGIGCGECQRNTRYCGLLLTCTTGSGIFSSAAVKQTLMKPGLKLRREAVEEEKSSRFFTPLAARTSPMHHQDRPAPVEASFFTDFAFERIP